jgi:hypothetical protein
MDDAHSSTYLWRNVNTITTGREVLTRAARKAGGLEQLSAELGISMRVLTYYLAGHEAVPDAVFIRALDVILDAVPAA